MLVPALDGICSSSPSTAYHKGDPETQVCHDFAALCYAHAQVIGVDGTVEPRASELVASDILVT